ncbi:CBS domain-containing protein [Lachnoclostridium sp. Marseille-P6806]|uniref:CBS domain-containing protein n=1 Tax=Lachnoclostridium sp. Marseille-P6806 TaxID=2364793 RepID=UPI00103203E0|nr:CBS domain-containing protein [Lachnoclostridium sp. Marseille-P6806]
MNILFFLTPKIEVNFVYDTDTLRQVMEKMDAHQFASVPIINERTGYYCGTLTEGDLLRAIKEHYDLSLKKAEDIPLMSIARRRDYLPVRADAAIEDLIHAATSQNFVPVTDDSGAFIGIVTRKDLMQFLTRSLHLAEKERDALRDGEKSAEPAPRPRAVRELVYGN